MKVTNAIRTAVILSTTVLVALNFLFAQLQFSRTTTQLSGRSFNELSLPTPRALRAAFLNYTSFAADLSWIALNVNLGASRREHRRLEHLLPNALAVQNLDPTFYRLYQWFPAVWLFSHQPTTFSDVEVATEFVLRGVDQFPDDTRLPFSAAMSYVGIDDADDGARIIRYRRIVELLERAAVGAEVHPDNPFVLAYHRRRLRSFEQGRQPTRDEERRFYSALYLRTADSEVKRRLLERMHELGGPADEMRGVLEADAEFEARQQATLPIVPADLFLFLSDAI